MYIMPKGASDETVVGMCLRDEDWTMLKQDKEWTRFAMYLVDSVSNEARANAQSFSASVCICVRGESM